VAREVKVAGFGIARRAAPDRVQPLALQRFFIQIRAFELAWSFGFVS
jgi:hypothetical protein